MTAAEFMENINSMDDLSEFLDDARDDYLSDYDYQWYESISDAIEEDISYCYNDWTWRELRDALNGCEDMDYGCGWYRRDGSFDYVYVDGDVFEDVKNDVYDRYERNGWFDDPDGDAEADDEFGLSEEEDGEEEEIDPYDLVPVEEETISIMEFCVSSAAAVMSEQERRIREAQEREEAERRDMEEFIHFGSVAG